MSGGILEVAADLAALGVNPLPFLTTKDEIIRSFYFALRDKMLDRRKLLDHNLAVTIASEVSRMFK